MRITLKEHTPYWNLYFQREKEQLAQKLKTHVPRIEHIGSTSIKGMIAKPTIDILIGIQDDTDLDAVVKPLQAMKYIYVQKYNTLMPFRRFFIKVKAKGSVKPNKQWTIREGEATPDRRTHERLFHLHVVHRNSDFFEQHIAFRNHLRQNKHDAEMYALLKQQLAQLSWDNENGYAAAKAPFIQQVLKNLGY